MTDRGVELMQLSSNGVALGMGADEFGQLCEASALLGDFDALHDRMDEDGYVLFRGLGLKRS
jgi:hypothetical protein